MESNQEFLPIDERLEAISLLFTPDEISYITTAIRYRLEALEKRDDIHVSHIEASNGITVHFEDILAYEGYLHIEELFDFEIEEDDDDDPDDGDEIDDEEDDDDLDDNGASEIPQIQMLKAVGG